MSTTGIEKTIPFLDLSRQHKEIEPELRESVSSVLARGSFVLGEQVSRFESEWSSYCGASECAGVASGTDAVSLALLASGAITAGRGDEVITPALSAGYTALAIVQAGAIPVFADVDPSTLLIDPTSVERLITSRTRAIVPVHLYGQICDLDGLTDLAGKHDLKIIEDAAQAHGAWRIAESERGLHRTAAFSFYPTKNLGACGDGGAVVSDDVELVDRVKVLRQGGHPEALTQSTVGRNSRLDEVQAAILRVKLRWLDEWNQRRSKLAAIYDELLVSSEHVRTVQRRPGGAHANHLYVIRTEERDELRAFLSSRRVETAVHYPMALHRASLFSAGGLPSHQLDAADSAAAEVVSLPMNSHLEEWEAAAAGNAIIEFARR